MCAVSILQYQKKMLQAICSEPSNKDDYGISAFLSPRMSLAPIQQGNGDEYERAYKSDSDW